jgi:hypothetical protein
MWCLPWKIGAQEDMEKDFPVETGWGFNHDGHGGENHQQTAVPWPRGFPKSWGSPKHPFTNGCSHQNKPSMEFVGLPRWLWKPPWLWIWIDIEKITSDNLPSGQHGDVKSLGSSHGASGRWRLTIDFWGSGTPQKKLRNHYCKNWYPPCWSLGVYVQNPESQNQMHLTFSSVRKTYSTVYQWSRHCRSLLVTIQFGASKWQYPQCPNGWVRCVRKVPTCKNHGWIRSVNFPREYWENPPWFKFCCKFLGVKAIKHICGGVLKCWVPLNHPNFNRVFPHFGVPPL